MSFLKKFASNKLGVLTYKGTWDANANLPELNSGLGVSGNYYIVSVAGTTLIDGVSNWEVGDWIIYNSLEWQRLNTADNTVQNSEKGSPDGVATLDGNGKIPSSQLPDLSAPVTSVNGEIGDVVLDTDDVSEGAINKYFSDALAQTAAVVDSMAGSQTNQAPSVSSVKGAIQFRPEYSRYVAYNGSDSTGNGSEAAPYRTVQAAMDSLPAPVAGANIEDCVIYIYPGVYNETLSWTRSNTHLVGLQAPRKNIQAVSIKGGIDFAIGIAEPGGIFANISSISNILVANLLGGTRNVLNYTGNQQVILQLINSQVHQTSAGYSAVSMNNTAPSLSRLYLDNTVINCVGTGAGHALDLIKGQLFSAFNSEIYRLYSTDVSARAIKMSNNSVVSSISNSQIISDKDYVIEMAGTGGFTAALSLIQNGTANKSGILIAAGTVCTVLNCSFNIAAGTGKAIDGSAGAVIYYASNIYLANTSVASAITKLQAAIDTTTSVITEGSNQYFTTARARTAAVVNSTAGSETDQAPSISAMKAYVAANTISGVVRYGTSPMTSQVSTFTVSFSDIGSTSYVVLMDISNTVDTTPRHLSSVITAKASNSFSFTTSQTTDSANYVVNYYIIKL